MGNEESSGKKVKNDITVTWKKFERCPFQPREGQSCAAVGNKLFVFGGVICAAAEDNTGQQTVSNQETNQLVHFDLEKNAWRELQTTGDVPEPRSGSTLSAVGDKLYMFGGLSEDRGWLNDFYVFDTGCNSWSKVIDFEGLTPSPRDKLTSSVIGNFIYFVGGFGPDPTPAEELEVILEDDGDEEYDDVEIQEIEQEQQAAKFTWFGDVFRYDTVSNRWDQLSSSFNGSANSPSPRAAHSMCAVDNALVIFGGRDSVGRQNDIWSFSPDTRQWMGLKPSGWKPDARSFHAAVAVGKRMVVLGGRSITNQHFRDFHVYDLECNLWLQPSIKGDFLPSSMGMHSLSLVNKDILLCFGTSELDPITNSCTKYHQDCFAISSDDILSGGAVVSEEHSMDKNGTQQQNALPQFLNLQPTSAEGLNGV